MYLQLKFFSWLNVVYTYALSMIFGLDFITVICSVYKYEYA